jgi:hypothetical protein
MKCAYSVFFFQIVNKPRRIIAAPSADIAANILGVSADEFTRCGGESKDIYERAAARCYPLCTLSEIPGAFRAWEYYRETDAPAEIIRAEPIAPAKLPLPRLDK